MAVYTLFGQPASPATLQSDTGTYTMGVEFYVTKAATATGVWFFSATGAANLPSKIYIFSVPGGGFGANQVASWSGAAGSGWVRAAFTTPVVVLPGYRYKAAIGDNAGSNFYSTTAHYWDTGGGQNGITNGVLVAPNNATAQGGGQDTFIASIDNYPTTVFNASNYWVDVEITYDPTQPTGSITGGPWTQVFNEDFDAPVNGKPDPAVWATHYIEGDFFRQQNGGTEIQWSAHNGQALSVSGSVLTITASFAGAWPAIQAIDPAAPKPSPSQVTTPACGDITYLSGTIQSHPGFQCTYGYVEAMIQVPNVANAWPAFWRHTSDDAWPPEIDIEEALFPPSQTATYHDPSGTNTNFNYPGAPTDYTQWHVFGCRWSAADITFFLDGSQVGTYTTVASITALPMHLIFDLAVQNGASSANFPCVMKVDFVRAWTVTGVPAQPKITSVTPASGVPAGDGNLTVNFGAVSGATSYRVTVCAVDANADGVPFSMSGTHNFQTGASSPITVGSLKPGARFTATVAAINATGYSVESLPVPSLAPSSAQPIPGDQMTSSGGDLYAATWERFPIRRYGV